MTTAAHAIRWLEHLLLILLIIIVLALVAPFDKMSRASSRLAVSSDVLLDASAASGEMVSLLPDIATIYRVAVTYPYQQAREDITDPDLLAFYAGYLKVAGLS